MDPPESSSARPKVARPKPTRGQTVRNVVQPFVQLKFITRLLRRKKRAKSAKSSSVSPGMTIKDQPKRPLGDRGKTSNLKLEDQQQVEASSSTSNVKFEVDHQVKASPPQPDEVTRTEGADAIGVLDKKMTEEVNAGVIGDIGGSGGDKDKRSEEEAVFTKEVKGGVVGDAHESVEGEENTDEEGESSSKSSSKEGGAAEVNTGRIKGREIELGGSVLLTPRGAEGIVEHEHLESVGRLKEKLSTFCEKNKEHFEHHQVKNALGKDFDKEESKMKKVKAGKLITGKPEYARWEQQVEKTATKELSQEEKRGKFHRKLSDLVRRYSTEEPHVQQMPEKSSSEAAVSA